MILKILIPGGSGYIGAWLIPHLLADGHQVTAYDMQFFGHGHLPDNDSLSIVQADVRDQDAFSAACQGQDAVIYLASISAEKMCRKNPRLARSVVYALQGALRSARHISRFIYASSAAIYGSSLTDATEDTPLEPTTIYGRGKMASERMLKGSSAVIVRSASVCGYSPHQRFDLTVNKMAHDAARKGVITVNGGDQKRSHIHIKDICDFYRLLLTAPLEKIAGQTFNVVAQNQKIIDTAWQVADFFQPCRVEIGPHTDNRSYSVDGSKAQRVFGWKTKFCVQEAVADMKVKFKSGYWPDSQTNPVYQNVADGLA